MKKTRFPPEPNGYLHLGHCKSIFINYEDGNQCNVRLDDTNPSSEKQMFVDNIIEDIRWLGFDPGNITYTSDYFDILYNYACILIQHGFAYVDFTDKKIINEERHAGIENEYRKRPPSFSLTEFENMKQGNYKNNECVLRLKIDMQNVNYTLRDPIAYRIHFTPHYRTGTKWVIYPSYDYSHGIIDALENITHSYCTDEFYIRRDLYYWTPQKLIECGVNLRLADVVEYGKLSIENGILSKRNINKLIDDGNIATYDDPRLLTIKGLRRRGFTPKLIQQITECSGMEKKETTVSSKFIKNLLRTEYNEIAWRAFAVIDPLHVKIVDLHENEICLHGNHQKNDYGSHENVLSRDIYIEREDFMEVHDPKYYRFTPSNLVRLRYGDGFYTYEKYEKDTLYIKKASVDGINTKKIKGCVHWVSKEDSVEALFELYDDLVSNHVFNTRSKITCRGYVEKYCLAAENTLWNFERVGYFKLDRYENETPVFIRIVELVDNKKV